MTEIIQLFGYSAKAVASVIIIAFAGVVLLRTGIIKKDNLRALGQLIFYATLPCLLFTKVAEKIDLDKLCELWIVPVSCELFVIVGIVVGFIVMKLVKPAPEFAKGLVAVSTFGNAGYLPIPLIAAITSIFPVFQADEHAGALGIAYISAFLMCFSPTMWMVGFNLISGRSIRQIGLKQIVTPPIIGMFCGIVVGLTPALKSGFCTNGTWLNVLFKAAGTLGMGTIPCALIILGASLAYGPDRTGLGKRTIVAAVVAKLVIMPIMAIFYIIGLRYLGIYNVPLLMAVVLVVEAASPPANNLVVMCNLCNREIESRMAAILFWGYLCCIPTLTLFILVSIRIFG